MGSPRQPKVISKAEAVVMWWRHQNYNNLDALAILLQYNKGDITQKIIDWFNKRLH